MSVLKSKNSQVETYQFGKINPTGEESDLVRNFDFKTLDRAKDFSAGVDQVRIRKERELEARSGFAISPIVKQHRGLVKQAENDYEKAVATEVAKRLELVQKQAYDDGFAQGQEDGHKDAHESAKADVEAKIQELADMVDNLNEGISEIYEKSKNDAYLMIKNLTKWIILKEVDEKYYLTRLLEKLIYEINTKSNLTLRVNEQALGYMPEVIKIVERKIGMLTNVRVEIDHDQSENGIVLESENTIVDGSLTTQFNAIDRIFENAGVNES